MRVFTLNENLFFHPDENGELVRKNDNLHSLLELESKLRRNLMLLESDIEAAERFITSCKKQLAEDEEYSQLVKSKIGEVVLEYTTLANNQ